MPEYKPMFPSNEMELEDHMINQLNDMEAEPDQQEETHPEYDANGMMVIDHADENPTKNKMLDVRYPVFMLNFPLYASNDVKNNVWMSKESKPDDKINLQNAWKQWIDFYALFSNFGIIYILPSEQGLQDQTYVANIGFKIPGENSNDYVLANFRSTPRTSEEDIARTFLHSMKYDVTQCPYFFEGEADLKYLKDKTCIGGYGIRTDVKAHQWMNDRFGLNIIPVRMHDEYLYHLDCSIFPLSTDTTLVCTELFDPEDLQKIEQVTEIMDAPVDLAYSGMTNSVLCSKTVFMPCNIDELEKDDENYMAEVQKINLMGKYCSKLGNELVLVNISEFYLGGAMLSCMVNHLNYFGKL